MGLQIKPMEVGGMQEEIHVTTKEWYVMKCLWERSPKTLMELVAELSEEIGWSKSTCATMVRRMTEKGLIRYKEEGKTKQFYPCVEKDEVTRQETRDFLSRIYDGSIGMMMSALVEQDGLSSNDIKELEKILKQAGQKSTESVNPAEHKE
jgi:BlaI family penicillinase repressor